MINKDAVVEKNRQVSTMMGVGIEKNEKRDNVIQVLFMFGIFYLMYTSIRQGCPVELGYGEFKMSIGCPQKSLNEVSI